MSKVRKGICLFLAVTFLTLLFAGCGGEKKSGTGETTQVQTAAETTKAAEPEQKEVKLTFVNWGSVEEATKGAFEAMVKGFEAKNPGITVEQVGYPYNNMKDQLLVLAAGGTAPDLAQVAPIWVAGLNDADALVPVNDVLDQNTMSDFYEGALLGTTLNGKQMSAPWIINPVLMYYNKTLMQKAGIAAPPTSWKEMVEQAGKISKLGKDENGNKIYGLSVASKKLFGAGYFFFVNIWQNGGEFTDKDGKVVINSPGTVNAFAEIKTLMKEEVVPAGLEIKETRNLFAQGQVGFHFDVQSIMAVFENGSPKGAEFAKEYSVMRVPGITGPEGVSFSSDHHFVIFKDSKYQKEAVKLVDFLTGTEGIQLYLDNNVEVIGARKTVEGLDYYKNPKKETVKPFIEAVSTIRSLPVQNAEFIKACEEVADAVQRVGLNDEDPAKVVEELDKKVKALYKQ